jgi:hypothetical protein
MSVRNEYLQDAKDPSDPLCLHLLHDLLSGLKLMDITWSLEQTTEYGKNSAGIDVAIARDNQQNDYHLFVRQCIKIIDNVTGEAKQVCCGGFRYNLRNSNTMTHTFLLPDAKFYTADNLLERFKPGKI